MTGEEKLGSVPSPLYEQTGGLECQVRVRAFQGNNLAL